MTRTVIIGSGISGCVCAFYNGSSILCDEIQGKKDNPFVFIQRNKYTEKLLSDIDLKAESSFVKIFASDKEEIADNKIVHEDRRWYYGTDKISNIGKNNCLEVYNITEREICDRILGLIDSRVMNSRVKEITPDSVCLENGEIIHYDRLVSTVPFDIFNRLYPSWDWGGDIQFGNMYYSIDDYSDHYSSIEYYRGEKKKTVKNAIQGKIAIEYDDPIGHMVIKNSRFYGRINPPPEGVSFVGRFSTGNPRWRIEDSIFVAQNGYEIMDMIDEQRRFDDAVKEKSGIVKEERLKNLILGAHSELSELLREIPHDMHKRAKWKIKSTDALEECIDVWKYTLAIMHEFDYTPREIYDKFFEKSNILWDRFEEEFYGGV